MQPILVIALIGVAAAATSVGFLNTNIMLTVQNFGVGEETLETPISDANIDFSIGRMVTSDAAGRTIFMNIIDACSFHYPEENTAVYPGLAFGSSKVICKLTDMNGNVVAEGTRVGMIAASQTVQIAITDLAYDGANKVMNIHDVTVVALGDDPTFFEANPVPPQEAAPKPPNEATVPSESDFLEVEFLPETDELFETVLPEVGGTIESIPFVEIVTLSEVGFSEVGFPESDPFSEIRAELDPFSEVDAQLGEGGTILESNFFTEVRLLEVGVIIGEIPTVESPIFVETLFVPETFLENFLVPETMGENAPPPGP